MLSEVVRATTNELSMSLSFRNSQASPVGNDETLFHEVPFSFIKTLKKTTTNFTGKQERWGSQAQHKKSSIASISPTVANVYNTWQQNAR